ncbi:hypothetical protein [Undibacterium sp. Xuan67W]|uniref:hypothetical protein n=1 Tax=Undibacterium sp. Xuan67W TaxID=3413057 RepID=UPI003BF5F449
MKLKIEPLWTGLTTFVACLYTWWSMEHIYTDMSSGNGAGVMVFYIFSLLIFGVIWAMIMLLVLVVLILSANVLYRAFVIAASTVTFFILHGVLGPIALLICAAFSCYIYIDASRKWEDEEELKRFE